MNTEAKNNYTQNCILIYIITNPFGYISIYKNDVSIASDLIKDSGSLCQFIQNGMSCQFARPCSSTSAKA